MERRTDIITAERIMGKNFIGPAQLDSIKENMGIKSPFQLNIGLPVIRFDEPTLERSHDDFILVLGIPEAFDGMPLTINKLRDIFGFNPDIKEPCFYNQDWYLKEDFANELALKLNWYLIGKRMIDSSRGTSPDNSMIRSLAHNMPSAILACYTFFVYYFYSNGKILWENDYLWCKDRDSSGDQIYVGRYIDNSRINKNGFNIHRHLRIKDNYGIVKAFE